ncbi:exported protein, unknown function [Hepatocystis sp. ex Piliocolobus tephrosceles]|nr:exported protein, unknown function [Hepatocystis sp. ex Piliocolobus tephrosceles]
MFTTIFKIFFALFFVWTWINKSKANNRNIPKSKHGRALAQRNSFPNERIDHFYVEYTDNNKFYKHYEQHMISDDDQNNDIVPIAENYKNVSIYLTNIKTELVKMLHNRNEPQINTILRKDPNIQEKDLIKIYDLIKHVMSSAEYLQIINKICQSLKSKNLNNNEQAETYYKSMLYLLNTYFFLTNNNKDFKKRIMQLQQGNQEQLIFKKKKFKFKAKYLNIFKLNKIIDKHFKTKVLKYMIKEKIDPNATLSFKKLFKLCSYAFCNPILISTFLFLTIPTGSFYFIFMLQGLYLLTCVHSLNKIYKNVKHINRIIEGSQISNKKKFIL